MKKKLLSEAQVRRFMGLAGLQPLKENLYEEEEEEAAEDAPVDDFPAEEPAGELPAEEPVGEPEGEEADLEMDEDALMRIKTNLDELQADLEPLLSQVEGDLGDEAPVDDLPAPETDGEEEAVEIADEDEEEETMDMMEAELAEVNMELSEEEIVNEVARRVAKRIVEAKRAHTRMNEALGRKTKRTVRRKK